MNILEMIRRIQHLIFRGRMERELAEEMELHQELRARRLREAGVEAEESRYAARRRFGNVASLREASHDIWGLRWLEHTATDFRLAARNAWRTPSFTLLAIGSLSLGLAATTAIFSFVNAIVLKTLPVRDASRLVVLRQHNEAFHMENCCFSHAFLRELRKTETGLSGVFGLAAREVDLVEAGRRIPVTVELVSGNYFEELRVRPQVGRLLNEADDRVEKGSRACVISDRLWRGWFGGSPEVLGRTITMEKETFQIAGVSQVGFEGASLHGRRDVQIASAWAETFYGTPRDVFSWMQLIGRLKPGVSTAQAAQGIDRAGLAIERSQGFRVSDNDRFALRDGSQGLGSRKEKLGGPVLLLLSIVGLVLVMACANLAALWLVRSMERAREAAIRVALGASRLAVVRQFLAQSLLLSVVSGAVAWWLSQLFIEGLLRLMGPEGTALVEQVRPNPAVIAFFGAVTIGCGLLFGLLPAVRVWRADPMPLVKAGTLFGAGQRAGAYRVLISTQIAISLALVFTAGLLAQTLKNLRGIDLGFQPQHVAQAPVDFGRLNYSEAAAGQAMETLLARARALPGVQSAAVSTINVLTGSMASFALRIPGYTSPKGEPPTSYFMRVSSGYFRTMGIPLWVGRDFEETDTGEGEAPTVVNQQFARRYLQGDALGRPFAYGGGRKVRVVGVAGTTKYRWLKEEPEAVLYLPAVKGKFPDSAYLQVRSTEPAGVVLAQLRTLVKSADARLPLDRIITLEAQLDETLAAERILALLSTALSLLAVALAAIGLYGVLSYSAARRTREIEIRIAIGAGRADILTMLLRECVWMVAAGVAAGVPLALLSGRLIQSQLYGLRPADPATTALATLALLAVSMAAAILPAWKATNVDPLASLRYE